VKLNGRQLTFSRHLEMINGTYSKDTYQDLVDFYQSIADTDVYTMTLVKGN